MRSLTALLLLGVQPFALGVVATKDWWMQGLPKCWQGCYSDTRPGCSSSKCICQTTQDNGPYLPAAVSCAVSKCKADEWAINLVLGPLALYCAAIQSPIPDQVMSAAYAASSQDDDDEPPRPTSKPSAPLPAPSKPAGPQVTTRRSDITQELTSTISSTFTRTTTENGNTLQIVVPIVIGPNGMFTGGASTSTITGGAASTASPSSAGPSPNPSPIPSSPLAPEAAQPSSTSRSQSTQRPPSSGNGSPFENMQAGATRWMVTTPLLGLAVVVFLVRY